ncbi:transcriptional repressor WHI5 NDAI_0F00370 [Naumovozyma dairenensis CBS 421]|uniref:Uncharacterized protein n=1 Tax=Naumovozyma dairenensis (strain ATCC 10597 / BCRC 20456 / CBS 421 / NBRC 0211 / NRRL Y-12639) TaxID=1071378 RepID=G0WC45_NAUDC|nr:hypothetical protein NDAI_0F00370 [Naumovozyma dairenensis CBS 421]CCD25356.1 hypothetical protein NDAI_0F00370 [Naumovozyma dairenensis CBS 421]
MSESLTSNTTSATGSPSVVHDNTTPRKKVTSQISPSSSSSSSPSPSHSPSSPSSSETYRRKPELKYYYHNHNRNHRRNSKIFESPNNNNNKNNVASISTSKNEQMSPKIPSTPSRFIRRSSTSLGFLATPLQQQNTNNNKQNPESPLLISPISKSITKNKNTKRISLSQPPPPPPPLLPTTPKSKHLEVFFSPSPNLKTPNINTYDNTKNDSIPIKEISQNLKTRLNYAFIKLKNGWTEKTLSELENDLASNQTRKLNPFSKSYVNNFVDADEDLEIEYPTMSANLAFKKALSENYDFTTKIISPKKRHLNNNDSIEIQVQEPNINNNNNNNNMMVSPIKWKGNKQSNTTNGKEEPPSEVEAIETLMSLSSPKKPKQQQNQIENDSNGFIRKHKKNISNSSTESSTSGKSSSSSASSAFSPTTTNYHSIEFRNIDIAGTTNNNNNNNDNNDTDVETEIESLSDDDNDHT